MGGLPSWAGKEIPVSEVAQLLGPIGTLEVAAQAAARANPGLPMLDLIGAPVLPMPPHVIDAAVAAMTEPEPRDTAGLPALRFAIAESLAEDQGLAVDPDRNLLVTHGAMHGLAMVFRALVDGGDEVLVPAPCFFFEGAIRLSGAVPRYVISSEANRWRWDFDALEDAVSTRTRAILLCNPNNPDGLVPTASELRSVIQIASRHNLAVVADESYQRFVYDGRQFTPLASLRDEYPNVITVTSLSKNYAFANWRLGYIAGPHDQVAKIRRIFEWEATYCGLVPQRAALAAITGPQDWVMDVIATYQAKRDFVYAAVQGTELLSAVQPEGGAFLLLNCSQLGRDPSQIQQLLFSRGIRAVPGGFFNAPDSHVRIVYGGAQPILDELAERLASIGRPSMVKRS